MSKIIPIRVTSNVNVSTRQEFLDAFEEVLMNVESAAQMESVDLDWSSFEVEILKEKLYVTEEDSEDMGGTTEPGVYQYTSIMVSGLGVLVETKEEATE